MSLLSTRRNGSNYGLSLFDEFFNEPFFRGSQRDWPMDQMMKTDVREENNQYIVDIDLPGFDKEDIQAELKDGYLTISAAKESSNEEKDDKGNYIRRERYSGSCRRSFYIGEQVKEEDIKAAYKQGILSLTFPKEDPQRIEEQKKFIAIE